MTPNKEANDIDKLLATNDSGKQSPAARSPGRCANEHAKEAVRGGPVPELADVDMKADGTGEKEQLGLGAAVDNKASGKEHDQRLQLPNEGGSAKASEHKAETYASNGSSSSGGEEEDPESNQEK